MVPSWPQVPGYVVLDPVGAGAGGQVWRARREADDLLVALKVVGVTGGGLDDALREAGVLARVRHPHVLHLYDVLPLPDEAGSPSRLALAVQLAGGGSLAQVLAARRHLTAGEVVTLLAPLGDALAQLHGAGVVHGDVSPANVLFLADGMPMLGDVGVARLVGELDRAVHGTDGMVAPEVLEGFHPGPEADVYALGALAWWCLTGEVPGWVGTRADLADLIPEVPEQMRELVQRAMSPEPEDRPEAQEVAAAVLTLADPEPIEVAPDADPAVGLTRRLRAAARKEPQARADGPAGAGRWWRRRRSRGRPARHRRGGQQPATGRSGLLAGRRSIVASLVLLLAVAAVAALVVDRDASNGGPVDTARPAATADGGPTPEPPVPAPPRGSAPAGSQEAAADTVIATTDAPPEAPRVRATVQTLVQARATAWSRTDPDLLGAALAADSPALETDRAALAEAVRRNVAYDGLAFQVLEASLESVDGSVEAAKPAAQRLRVRATVRRDAMSAHTGSGELSTVPPRVDEITLELRRGEQGWRIWSWQ